MWLLDSGASTHFTNHFDAFIKYQPYVKPHHSQTANGLASPWRRQCTHMLQWESCIIANNLYAHLHLSANFAWYICTLLKENCLYAQSAKGYIHIIDNCIKCDVISFHTHGDSIMYWVRAFLVLDITSMNINMIAINYELLHCHLGHLSKDVLKATQKHMKDFPRVTILPVEPVCPGCQLGK